MFNFFKKDESKELSKHLKTLTKEINRDGGPIVVCSNFLNFLDKDDLFNTLGIFNQKNLLDQQAKLMLSALLLLNDIKNQKSLYTKDESDDLIALAKASYIFSNCYVSDAEFSKILLMPYNQALEAIRQLKEPYEVAWNEWLITDIDVDKLATIALIKFK